MLMLKQIGEIKIPYGEYKDAVLKALDDIGVKYCNANLSIDGWTIKVYDEDKETNRTIELNEIVDEKFYEELNQ